MNEPVRFHLERDTDITGASGTGHVADGVVWPDGTVTVRWRGELKSTVNWDRLEDAETVHGHGGATRIVWDDPMVRHDCCPHCTARTGSCVRCGVRDAADGEQLCGQCDGEVEAEVARELREGTP
jgi:hypothetical protein